MKTFVVGDIHGNIKGLTQSLDRAGFFPLEDTLILLGDLVDGGLYSYEVVDYLANLPNCIFIRGNHDEWWRQFLKTGKHPTSFTQGADNTLKSYINNLEIEEELTEVSKISEYVINRIPKKHKDFFENSKIYYIDKEYRMFVHGGFDRYEELVNQPESNFYWDRELLNQAMSCPEGVKLKMLNDFKVIFLGHTTTLFWKTDKPIYSGGVWNLDTGAGSSGKVTVMNVETEEYFQSENVLDLYGFRTFYR